MTYRTLRALALGLLVPAATAQTTWIVDSAGGAGVDFTDLPAAFAAVSDGDTVAVRAGAYTPGTLRHAILLVGEAGVVVTQSSNTPLTVEDIGAGRICSIRALEFAGTAALPNLAGLRLANCAGVVTIDDISIATPTTLGGLHIDSCAAVTINGSTIRPAVRVTDSNVSISDSAVLPNALSTNGLLAIGSRIELSQCVVHGSSGGGHAPAGDGIRASDSLLTIRGDRASEIRGGPIVFGPYVATSIRATGITTLLIDPDVTLSHPPIGLTAIESRDLPSLSVDGGQRRFGARRCAGPCRCGRRRDRGRAGLCRHGRSWREPGASGAERCSAQRHGPRLAAPAVCVRRPLPGALRWQTR
jgi:hypothetical protein